MKEIENQHLDAGNDIIGLAKQALKSARDAINRDRLSLGNEEEETLMNMVNTMEEALDDHTKWDTAFLTSISKYLDPAYSWGNEKVRKACEFAMEAAVTVWVFSTVWSFCAVFVLTVPAAAVFAPLITGLIGGLIAILVAGYVYGDLYKENRVDYQIGQAAKEVGAILGKLGTFTPENNRSEGNHHTGNDEHDIEHNGMVAGANV